MAVILVRLILGNGLIGPAPDIDMVNYVLKEDISIVYLENVGIGLLFINQRTSQHM